MVHSLSRPVKVPTSGNNQMPNSTMSNIRHVEYTPLMVDKRATLNDSKVEAGGSCPEKACRSSEHQSLPVFLAVVLSLLSLVISILSLLSQRHAHCGAGSVDMNLCVPDVGTSGELKASSTLAYVMPTKTIGAEISRPTHAAGSAISPTEPFKTFRISSLYPGHKFPMDRRVLLTENDLSLTEFHLPVSGFTHCALRGTWPGELELHDRRAVDIEIWDVSALSSLNASHEASTRKRHLGSISAAYGTISTTAPFRCVQWLPFIIELSCTNPGCTLEYRIDEEGPKLGLN